MLDICNSKPPSAFGRLPYLLFIFTSSPISVDQLKHVILTLEMRPKRPNQGRVRRHRPSQNGLACSVRQVTQRKRFNADICCKVWFPLQALRCEKKCDVSTSDGFIGSRFSGSYNPSVPQLRLALWVCCISIANQLSVFGAHISCNIWAKKYL